MTKWGLARGMTKQTVCWPWPVVAFDVGGISDWLKDGRTGFLIRPGDVGALAEKLELVLTQPSLAEEMGRRAREVVEREFSPEGHLSGLLEAYQVAIDAHGDTR